MDVKEIIEKNNLKSREDINNFMKDLVGEIMQEIPYDAIIVVGELSGTLPKQYYETIYSNDTLARKATIRAIEDDPSPKPYQVPNTGVK